MLNTEFAEHAIGHDYYPAELRPQIDEINAVAYANVNNDVYRCGFASTQKTYEAAAKRLFEALHILETQLSLTRYLVGNTLSEADWRLFTTLVRFDAVYHGHFKCNLRRIEDYPNLSAYLRELYPIPGIAEIVSLDQIKRRYSGTNPPCSLMCGRTCALPARRSSAPCSPSCAGRMSMTRSRWPILSNMG